VKKTAFKIIQKNCIKCGRCKTVCPVNAVNILPGIIDDNYESKN